jgi:hypothetical protein
VGVYLMIPRQREEILEKIIFLSQPCIDLDNSQQCQSLTSSSPSPRRALAEVRLHGTPPMLPTARPVAPEPVVEVLAPLGRAGGTHFYCSVSRQL